MAKITGTASGDVLNGTAAADEITGLGGNDELRGFSGNDVLYGGPGDDDLFGAGGNDVLYAGEGVDALDGGAGDDILYGASGNAFDTMRPGLGSDYVYGGLDATTVLSYSNASKGIFANLGDGFVQEGTGGYDHVSNITYLEGTGHDDYLRGNNGGNRIDSDGGSDIIDGSAGNDVIYDGDGNCALYGGDDNDLLLIYGGRDVISGGVGADKFVTTFHLTERVETVIDFTPGEDHLVVTFADPAALVAGAIITDGGSTVFTMGPQDYLVINNHTDPTVDWFATNY